MRAHCLRQASGRGGRFTASSRPWIATLGSMGCAAALVACGDEATGGRFDGAAQTLAGTYAAGQNIRIVSPNGSVTARTGSSSGELTAVFRPYVLDAEDEEQAADAMSASLTCTVDDGGNTIVISAVIAPGALAGLGVDLEVALPTSFAQGGFEVEQAAGAVDADLTPVAPTYTSVTSLSGAVDVRGAAGQIELAVHAGSCNLGVRAWSASDGTVDVATGNLALHVAPGISGRVDAQAGGAGSGSVTGPSPLPSDWSEEIVADNHRRYQFGPDAAAMGTLTARTAASGSMIEVATP